MRAIWRAAVTGLGLILALACAPARADTVALATGEYPPLSGAAEPGGGLLAQVVVAAYAAVGVTVQLSYLPWQRGYNETLAGTYTGSFPYVKNAEREALYLYSNPMLTDTIRMFALDTATQPPR